MKDVTDKNFGVIIAFLLPGFLLLWGLSYSFPDLAVWLNRSAGIDPPTVGNFLFATLASLAAGLLISAIRWLVVDHLLQTCDHLVKGLKRPSLDMSRLAEKDVLAAFSGAVENHYRYYQYYSNTLVAVIIGFVVYAGADKNIWFSKLSATSGGIGITLFLASGDSLWKYYDAASQILNPAKDGTNDKRLGAS